MIRLAGLTVAALLWLFAANAVMAQTPNCAPRDDVIAMLAGKYGETVQGGGFSGQRGTVVFTFANLETGSWSIIEVRPDGVACLMASGGMYRPPDLIPAGMPITHIVRLTKVLHKRRKGA